MQPHLSSSGVLIAFATAMVLGTSNARAQYASGFEALEILPTIAVPYAPNLWDAAAAAGTTGQDDYYWPAGTTSVPFQAQVYTGGVVTIGINDYGIADNPSGGAKFIVGNGPASPTFARAQRDMGYACSAGRWSFATDICAAFVGVLPTAQNLGSFSVQPFPGGQSFIALARWADVNTAANWNADYVWFNAAGTQLTESVGDPAFQNLIVGDWYRWETIVDLTTNEIIEVRITNLTAATPTVVNNPVGRYMLGGTAGSLPPTGFRFFAGGGVAGNVLAWDNPAVMATGSIGAIPGCDPTLAGTLTVSGTPTSGNSLTIGVDGPTPPITTPGQSLAGVAFSLNADANLPCGTPLGGSIAGSLLIGFPPAATLISVAPWAGPGSPVSFAFAMPSAGFNGYCIYIQGALIDLTTGGAMATSAARVVIGG